MSRGTEREVQREGEEEYCLTFSRITSSVDSNLRGSFITFTVRSFAIRSGVTAGCSNYWKDHINHWFGRPAMLSAHTIIVHVLCRNWTELGSWLIAVIMHDVIN